MSNKISKHIGFEAILYVDLDWTILRSDLLIETFFLLVKSRKKFQVL